MELPFFRECRAKVGKRFLPELSIKRLNDLQQPEACLTFPLLFHPAEMKKRYLVYEPHFATQNEGMEVTGMERDVWCFSWPCLVCTHGEQHGYCQASHSKDPT